MLADIVDELNSFVSNYAVARLDGVTSFLRGKFHITPNVALGADEQRTHVLFDGYVAAYSADSNDVVDVAKLGVDGSVLAASAREFLKQRLTSSLPYRLLPLLPRDSKATIRISLEDVSSTLMPEIKEIRRRYEPLSEQKYALREPAILTKSPS